MPYDNMLGRRNKTVFDASITADRILVGAGMKEPNI